MGLDQYLSGRKFLWTDYENPKNDRKEDGLRISTIEVELGYWRKHPNLHGYIVQTFAEGRDDCEPIELDVDAIDNIIEAIKQERLPHTEGFFFGASTGTQEERNEDVAIFEAALSWLEAVAPAPPMFVDEGKQEKSVHQFNEGAGDLGMVMRQVNIPKKLPRETRTVIYRASW